MKQKCEQCISSNRRKHLFENKDDYELHGEQALYEIFGGNEVLKNLIDELLLELDGVSQDKKIKFMENMFKGMGKDYGLYKAKYMLCDNINGCSTVYYTNPKTIKE